MDLFNEECLLSHNEYRRHHGVEPLVWSEELAQGAQEWADELARTGELEHSEKSKEGVGENVAMKKPSPSAEDFLPREAIDKWYIEVLDYYYDREDQVPCGHFSQIVWNNTKEVGFGRAWGKDKAFIVGQYTPPGNYMGQWREHVQPPLDGKPLVSDAMREWRAQDKGEKIREKTEVETVKGVERKTIVETYKRQDGSTYDKIKVIKDSRDSSPERKKNFFEKAVDYVRGSSSSDSDDENDDEKFINDVLKCHNQYRRMHGSPALKLSKDLNRISQGWAKHIATTGQFAHSTNKYNGERIGENIALQGGSANKAIFKGYHTVEQWYSEEPKFKYGRSAGDLDSGHFSQVIWKSTRELGVGRAIARDGTQYVVCNYYPAGNIMGDFAANVGEKH